jgi:hypothetical protein
MRNNGTDASQIEPAYRLAFEQWLDTQLVSATTEEAEYEILTRLIPLMESGQLIVDDNGREHQLVGGVVYDDATVAARIRRHEAANQSGRREKILYGLLILGVVTFILIALGVFTSGGDDEADVVAGVETEIPPTPTPIRENVLELADDLGGRVALGQPRTIEIRHGATEDNITLAIVPAQVDENGLIPYFKPNSYGDDTEEVAVWVFGTVINYVFGIPEDMVRGLSLDDTILMRTATGAVYAFAITEQFTAEPQEVELFSQRQAPGITLFALPASGEPLPMARAIYLAANEELTGLAPVAGVSEEISIGGIPFGVDAVSVDQTLDGLLDVQVAGHIGASETASSSNPLLVSLASPTGQYAPEGGGQLYAGPTAGEWTFSWRLPADLLLESARLQANSLYGESAVIDLGSLPSLDKALSLTVLNADWDEFNGEATVFLEVINEGQGTARLDTSYLKLTQQGGDIPATILPNLPTLIEPGGQFRLELRFRPLAPSQPVLLQAGHSLWEINGLPDQNLP